MPSLRLLAWKPELCALAWRSPAGALQCCVFNTTFAVVAAAPLEVRSDSDDDGSSGSDVVAFVLSSNEQFFLLATAGALYRCNLRAPASAALRDCIGKLQNAPLRVGLTHTTPTGAQRWTREAFGGADGGDATVVAVEHLQLVTAGDWDSAHVEAETHAPLALSKKQKLAVDALLAPHLVAGRGHRDGASRMVAMSGRDRFTVSVEFGQRVTHAALLNNDWAAVADLVQARLYDVPPDRLGAMGVVRARVVARFSALIIVAQWMRQ